MNFRSEQIDICKQLDELFDKVTNRYCWKENTCDFCCLQCREYYGFFRHKSIDSYIHSQFSIMSKVNQNLIKEKIIKLPETARLLNEYKEIYGWDECSGFLTKSGCTLPRLIRSIHCQKLICRWIKIDFTEDEISKIYNLLEQLTKYRELNNMLI